MKPSKTSLRPVARKTASPAFGGRGDRHGGLIELRRRHLAGDEAVPDQLIQLASSAPSLPCASAGVKLSIGRADRFVGFLRALVAGGVDVGLLRDRYCRRTRFWMYDRAMVSASADRLVESVRM